MWMGDEEAPGVTQKELRTNCTQKVKQRRPLDGDRAQIYKVKTF